MRLSKETKQVPADTASMSNTLPGLEEMLRIASEAPVLYQPAPFWMELNHIHLAQLYQNGFENFKRTVNNRYFNWRMLGILRFQVRAVLSAWLAHPSRSVFTARFPKPVMPGEVHTASFNPVSSWIYKTFVAMLAEAVEREDPRGLLGELEEPELGNPFLILHRGRAISQDLCNSVHEFYRVVGPTGRLPDEGSGMHVAELGAGYGRLAYVFLYALPSASYCIIDLPPALYISQRYLTTVYPNRRAFLARSFRNYEEIRQEFETAQVRFLFPHQLELLPPKRFDFFINISSLHEMTVAQVTNYLKLMDYLVRGRVYIKQWRVSRAAVNGCTLRERDYSIPLSWHRVYQHQHPVQRMFFEALYDVSRP